MLQRVIKIGVYVLLQVALVVVPISSAAQVTSDPVDLEDYPILHEASGYSVVVDGGADSSSVYACLTTVKNTLAALPEEHVEPLEKLVLVFDDEAKRGLAGGDIIKLRCSDISEEEMTAVLVHEMGHVVDIGMMKGFASDSYHFVDGERPVWDDDPSVDFYEMSWVSNEENVSDTNLLDFVTGYSETDPFEDFAESYLYYVLHGESFYEISTTNDRVKAKYEFLRDYVFEGVEYRGIDEYEPLMISRPYDATLLDYDLVSFWSRG